MRLAFGLQAFWLTILCYFCGFNCNITPQSNLIDDTFSFPQINHIFNTKNNINWIQPTDLGQCLHALDESFSVWFTKAFYYVLCCKCWLILVCWTFVDSAKHLMQFSQYFDSAACLVWVNEVPWGWCVSVVQPGN